MRCRLRRCSRWSPGALRGRCPRRHDHRQQPARPRQPPTPAPAAQSRRPRQPMPAVSHASKWSSAATTRWTGSSAGSKLNLADLAIAAQPAGAAQRRSTGCARANRCTSCTATANCVGLERKLSDSETLKVTRDARRLRVRRARESARDRATRTAAASSTARCSRPRPTPACRTRSRFELAEIFGYDIDFVLDIQPGDRFTVIYEEVFAGRRVRCGRATILAAKFVNHGREYRAVRYVDAARARATTSRRTAGACARPSSARRCSSRASARASIRRAHIRSSTASARTRASTTPRPIGTPVRAAATAACSSSARQGGYGNVVELEHGSRHRHGLRPSVALRARSLRAGSTSSRARSSPTSA